MVSESKPGVSQVTQKAWTLLDEFKAFAFKGNVVDLTIGVILGSAFHKIIDSLVSNLVMPFIAVLAPGNRGYVGWQVTLRGSTIHFGLFLADVVHFLIISAALFFFVVKFLGWVMKLNRQQKDALPSMTKDQELLTEIRDLLKARASTAG